MWGNSGGVRPRLRPLLADADINQAPDKIPHHVLQEGIGFKTDADHVPADREPDRVNPADRRFRLALSRPEAREIVLSQKDRRGLFHLLHIARPEAPSGPSGKKRHPDRLIHDPVLIGPPDRGKTG